MAKTTVFNGNIKGYDDDTQERYQRFSVTKTITEGGANNIKIAPGSKDISIMPHGLMSAKMLFIESDRKINVILTGSIIIASLDITGDGMFCLSGSLTNVQLTNKLATPNVVANVYYDITG